MLEVCCAIILNGSEILTVQHDEMGSHPLKWEFPGGKIQTDESAEQCIVREIQEELNVAISILTKLQDVEFDYGIKQVHLIPFVCRICSGEIKLTEHQALKWFNLHEWETIDWAEADRQLILKNRESLKSFLSGDE